MTAQTCLHWRGAPVAFAAGMLLLSVATTCRDASPPSQPAIQTALDVGSGDATLSLDGVAIEVLAPVKFQFTHRTANGAVLEHSMTIDGHEFGVRDGVFHVGDATYGRVAAGQRVLVDADGVTVDGERRGRLPAR